MINTTTIIPDAIYGPCELARSLGVDRKTINNWVKKGVIKNFHIRRGTGYKYFKGKEVIRDINGRY